MAPPTEKNSAFDEIDRDILNALQADGRQSFNELAQRVGLSPNAVAERFRRLVRSRAITAIEARIDPRLLGQRISAFVDLKLRLDVLAEHLEREIEKMPQVLAATLTTGAFDYTLRVACLDQAELVSVIERLRARAGVAETNTRLILRERVFARIVKSKAPRRKPGRFVRGGTAG